MTTETPNRPAGPPHKPARRQGPVAALRQAEARRHRWRMLAVVVAIVVVAGAITAMMLSSRPTSSTATRVAPTFSLPTTAGDRVSLADYRGHTVVLYFSEGAGCGSCIQQMTAIEQDQALADAAITVLPIVMNTREQIMHDMATYGAKTPFLLDDGTVSRAYGTIGRGMHEGLPGHSFVLIDKDGVQRWYGEYPSMWLSPADLLTQINKHLAT